MPHAATTEEATLRGLHGLLSLAPESRQDDLLDQLPSDVSAVLYTRPHDVLNLAHERLHSYPYKDVPPYWRACYEEAAIACARSIVEKQLAQRKFESGGTRNDWIDNVVWRLDMALIMTGATCRRQTIDMAMSAIGQFLDAVQNRQPEDPNAFRQGDSHNHINEHNHELLRPAKRRRLSNQGSRQKELTSVSQSWPTAKIRHPPLKHPIQRADNLSLPSFQKHFNENNNARDHPNPLIVSRAISHWPALDPETPERNWNNPQYLLKRTLGGRRLVPIEIGRSYTDEDWGQKIVRVSEFVENWMLDHPTAEADDESDEGLPKHHREVAYLAQHDLFAQIPALRNDISIPDYCYSSPPQRQNSSNRPTKEVEDDASDSADEPLLNAWFGPANTISPAHTDPHHNVFAQVVGYKYVRLFGPSQHERMYPRGVGDDGVDMGNTSQVDVGEAMRVLEGWDWDDGKVDDSDMGSDDDFERRFPLHEGAEYVEAVIGPGECLYIPEGWWHYVRSLSPSFSVSFWWN
ncbi:Clavaminate synthase-like protein [Rhizodiscina lignyota]|uniref:Clavaminate synthase-like protein n=1 Tax=Rhizodiscina lignyota TaxID=1504668 RepID=A0A9P4M694_9PEZI|nr:Clavaminate synthase-like protein [Rhizodiscina lignyota]